MTLFRLYTETRANLPSLIRAHGFDAATLIPARGLWRGTLEDTTIIEILTLATGTIHDIEAPARIATLADDIARVNGQDAVLVTRHEVGVSEVSPTTPGNLQPPVDTLHTRATQAAHARAHEAVHPTHGPVHGRHGGNAVAIDANGRTVLAEIQ